MKNERVAIKNKRPVKRIETVFVCIKFISFYELFTVETFSS